MNKPNRLPTHVVPPRAERRPVTSTHHGRVLTDDYAWLRDPHWQEVVRNPAKLSPDIRRHLEAENAYTEAMLSETRPLQAVLFDEMKGRIKEDDSSVPTPDGPYAYATDFVVGGQYPRLLRQPRAGGAMSVMLDGNREAEGKAYWALGASSHSPDHRYLAYAVDDKGSEMATMRVRDLATGRDLEDVVPRVRSLVWAADSRTILYVRFDDNHRALTVWRHKLGTPLEADTLVYEESDPAFYVGLGESLSGAFLVIHIHDHNTSEVRLIEAARPEGPPRLLLARRAGHQYSVEHQGDRFFILTNSGGAEDFRICEAPISDFSETGWHEVVAHVPGRLILEATAFAGHLVRLEREDGLPRIIVRRLSDGAEHAIAFEEEAYALSMSEGYEHATTMLRITYSSMTTPSRTYDYDMETRERVLRKVQEVPSGHEPEDYVTRRIMAPAADGALVPVSLLYRKGTPLDGSAPVLLYGYGAYGISMPSGFSTGRLSLVDRGFIFAIAHIRGGKEKGYAWYTSGKLAKKTNTFTDFIAAGEHLAKIGMTRRGRIIAMGGSAGGLLVGAVANMAPDLFLGVIADVPFVDVLNTMLDAGLPLTPPEWLEWGNPIESREEFEAIAAYSPYDNVRPQRYPHIFAYGGLTDPRVTYWEPAKWVAKLRATKTDDNLLLLKTNMEAGHGGASGRFEQLREIALDYAFALKIAGFKIG